MLLKNTVKSIKYTFVLGAIISLTGCVEMDIPNPFDAKPTVVEDVYYGQFTDIPVPSYMSLDGDKSHVTIDNLNQPVGLETFTGRTDLASINNAMLLNMTKYNWSLIGAVSGDTYVQVHKKASKYALIYITSGLLGSTMEVWIFNELSGMNNQLHNINNSNYGSNPSYSNNSGHADQALSDLQNGSNSQSNTGSYQAPASVYTEQLNN